MFFVWFVGGFFKGGNSFDIESVQGRQDAGNQFAGQKGVGWDRKGKALLWDLQCVDSPDFPWS